VDKRFCATGHHFNILLANWHRLSSLSPARARMWPCGLVPLRSTINYWRSCVTTIATSSEVVAVNSLCKTFTVGLA
jgi:hypothetical protein